MCRENEKVRRWQEIKIRQHRLKVEADQQATPNPNIEHMIKSGFSMSDIKGLHRNYSEDAAEADEMLKAEGHSPKLGSKRTPSRPPRKGSLPRNASQYDMEHNTLEVHPKGHMQRSTSDLDMHRYQDAGLANNIDNGDKKKRGRSPFRYRT